MRQVAGRWPAPGRGARASIASTSAAERLQKLALQARDGLRRRSRRAASGCTSGSGTARRSRRPGPSARCRRPDGPGRRRARPPAGAAPSAGSTEPLDRADVGDHGARLQRRAAMRSAAASLASTGTQAMTRSASPTASAGSVVQLIAEAELGVRARVSASRRARSARRSRRRGLPAPRGAAEEPIRPMPMQREARGLEPVDGSRLRDQEIGERRDDEAVCLLGADGHAQRVRQAIGRRRRAQHEPPRRVRKASASVGRACPAPSGNGRSRKLPTLGVTVEAELLAAPRSSQASQRSLWSTRAVDMRLVGDARRRRPRSRRPG